VLHTLDQEEHDRKDAYAVERDAFWEGNAHKIQLSLTGARLARSGP
jgi:hypothetical protein